MSDQQPLVEARGLVKWFEDGRIKALNGVDLTISEGEFVAIVGPSGCGKSTLLHLIAALDRPTGGSIVVAGHDLAHKDRLNEYRARDVGIVFQLDNLLPTLNAIENVIVPMFEGPLPPGKRRARATELMEAVGLAGKERQRPSELSGGERQRVAIARALANDPPLLLADEPTGRLDSESGRRVLALLAEIRKQRGLTVILVTHEQGVAQAADRVVHMLDGRVVDGETAAMALEATSARGDD
jgi:putative ABC transport system ATP-binding protein